MRLSQKVEKRRAKKYLFKGVILGLPCLLFFFLLDLIQPDQAAAWGPGVHMVTANWILQNLNLLPAAVGAALSLYPNEFRHGCLSADIFIGKGSIAREGHSHSWGVGMSLLSRAHTKRRMAFAYGYLSHLSADTVAHNVFVPETVGSAPGNGKLAHVYLEMQADRQLSWSGSRARSSFASPGAKSAERMLRNTVGHKASAFWLKRHIFKNSITVGGSLGWRASLLLMDSLFPHEQRNLLLNTMLKASTAATFDVLIRQEKSPVLLLDPVGTDALAGMRHTDAGESVFKSLSFNLLKLVPFNGQSKAGESFTVLDIKLPGEIASLPQYPMPESFIG